MKKFGFIKKVTAAATAAAMIASFGISAFALEGNRGDKITIDKITYSDTETSGVYKITVDFTAEGTNEIGMTMLTYGMNPTTEGAEVDMVLNSSWTDNQYDSETMKVIGVDQIPAVSVGDANNGKGRFEFNVSTNKGTDSIYLAKGKTALVALSGDGVNTPAVAPITITAVAGYAAPVTINEVALAANLTSEQIQNTIKEAVALATTSVYEKQGDSEALATGVALTGSNVEVGTFTKGTGDTYTGTVTIKAVDGVSVQTGGIQVAVTVNTVKTAVDAAKATAVEGMSAVAETDNKFTKTVSSSDNADANAVVTNNFVGKKVTLVDSTGTVTGTVDITSEMVTPGTYTEGETSAYTVAIPAGATSNSLLTVPAGGITVTVDVTVSAGPVGVTYILGDVNGDGKVNAMDWGILRNHVQKVVINEELNDTESRAFKAANVNKTGGDKLNAMDWGTLRNHVQKVVIDSNIGNEFTD